MDVNHLLETYIANINPLIQGLFIIILALIFMLLFFALKSKSGDETSSTIEGLEATLRKVIESTQHLSAAAKDTSAPTPGVSGGSSSEEMQKLQAELAAKEKKIAEVLGKVGELEKTSAATLASVPNDSAGLQTRIKDLEARLQEYEIIEDDIANLSLYKEENTRLKNELGKLSGTPVAVATKEPTPEKSESLEDALKAAGGLPTVDTPATPSPESPAPEVAEPPKPDLVNELSSFIDGKAQAAPSAPPATSLTPEPAKVVEEKTDEPEALKDLDTDKIMQEAGELKVPEPGTEPPKEEEGDVGQKLIDEFENFMKES